MKIAIVGSGISGLTAAHLLSAEHDVTILERAPTLGMDQSSVSYAGGRIDVPLRTFSEDYYPNLSCLYRELGVTYEVADYSFCCYDQTRPRPHFKYRNYLNHWLARLLGTDKLSLPAFTLTSMFYIVDYLKFMRNSPRDLALGLCRGLTFQQYCLARFRCGDGADVQLAG
jgi:predicted NAD/FAD-binding protein